MKAFDGFNPIAVFLFFLAVTVPVMFVTDPILTVLSLIGALAACLLICGGGKSFVFYGVLFVLMSLVNPLFYHNGVTVLFIMNDNPITLESLLYGVSTSAMIVSILIWFNIFSKIMTSDKLLYVFGSVSPKIALLLSMILRYIPLFVRQAKRVEQAQRALGLTRDDSIIGSIKSRIRVFSVMVTWTLENGIVTADSMTARGYGIAKRTFFTIYRFRRKDVFLMVSSLILASAVLSGMAFGAVGYTFYPRVKPPETSIFMVISYLFYGALALIPTITETEERLKWKYLLSKT